MNRAERRRMGKGIKERTYTLRQSDINRIKEEAKQEAVDAAIILLLSLPCKVLHDHFGFGSRKRLPQFSELVTEEYHRFTEGEMTLEDYQNFVYETIGIKFERT